MPHTWIIVLGKEQAIETIHIMGMTILTLLVVQIDFTCIGWQMAKNLKKIHHP